MNYYKSNYDINNYQKIKKYLNNLINTYSRRVESSNIIAHNNIFYLFKIFIIKRLRKFYYKYFLSKKSIDFLDNKNYFFYPIHVQPESSIDHLGNFYSNQLLIIKSIWKILPKNYILIIKDHIDYGLQNISFYKEINKMDDVFFLKENINSQYIIENSKAVFSVSGTSCLEASLIKKSFTFAKTFFNILNNSFQISINDLKVVIHFMI